MPLRVGIVFFWHKLGESGGTQIYRRELLRALSAFEPRHRYLVLNWQGEAPPLEPLPPNCETISFAPSAPALGARLWRGLNQYALRGLGNRLSRRIDHLGLDVVHFPAAPSFPPGVATPSVLSFFDMQHEFLPGNFSQATRLKRWRTYKASVDRAARVISPSRFTTDTLRARYRVPESKIVTLPVGLADDYQPVTDPRRLATVRQKYKLPSQFLLYPANNWPHKNHARLLRALARLTRDGAVQPHLVCTGARLAGSPPLEHLATAAALDPARLHDVGYVPLDDMPALYSAAAALVFPSLFEGFGIPVVEAMACGCPVICSKGPALVEVAGGAARFFDPLDTDDIAAAIQAVCADASFQQKLRTKGLERAEQFRWSRIAPRVAAVYAEASRL